MLRVVAVRAMAVTVSGALVLSGTGVSPALAQGASPAGPVDPPARVGQLAQVTGTVSYHLADATRWEPATRNLPVTTGTALWTEPGARAAVEVAGTRLVLDQSSELDMSALDDRALTAALPQGTVYARIRVLPPGETESVQTPRAAVGLTKAGRYEVTAGDTGRPTVVTVLEGEADIVLAAATGAGETLHVGPNQAATIVGDGQGTPFSASIGPAARDPFLTAVLAEERPARPAGATASTAPAFVERMTGGDALETYGEWATAPSYGPVWYPPEPAGFVPYRQGHWGYVAPWGWTWVDDAAWGFAPFHYGRWVEVSNRWGWVPGTGQPGPGYPVYAPALVAFLGGAALGAYAFGGNAGRGYHGRGNSGGRDFDRRDFDRRGAIGWVPLGPGEAYYPPYRVSEPYVRGLNAGHVTNITNVTTTYNTVVNNRGVLPAGPLLNRAGATAAPLAAMASSRSLAGLARPVPAGFAANAPTFTQPAATPTRGTVGLTPPVARQFGLPVAALAPRPGAVGAAPGPVLGPRPVGAAAFPSLGLRGAGPPGVIRPASPNPGFERPQPGQPPAGLPPLRAPEAIGGIRPNGGAPGPMLPAVVRPGEPARPPLAAPAGQGLAGAPPPRPEAVRPETPQRVEPIRPGMTPRAAPAPIPPAPISPAPIPPAAMAPRSQQPQRPPPGLPAVAPRPAPPPPMARPAAPPVMRPAPPPAMIRPAPPPMARPAPAPRPAPSPPRAAPPPPHAAPPPPRPAPARGGRPEEHGR